MDGGLSRRDPDLAPAFSLWLRDSPLADARSAPASCHHCPLSLYLCNLFLSLALSLPLMSTYLGP